MAKFLIHKSKDYTTMSNYHLRDKTISLKAKGLLSLMLSLPDDWDYTLRGLSAINKEGVDAIGRTVNELVDAGYLIVTQLRDEKGKFGGSNYSVYEFPQNKSSPDTKRPDTDGEPYTENAYTVDACTENRVQQNIDITKYRYNKNTKQSSSFAGRGECELPAEEKYPDDFERIWEAYPRKVEKLAAYQEYRNRRRDGFSEDELVKAVKRYAEECTALGKSSRYIKHPATFFGKNKPFMDYLRFGWQPPEKQKLQNKFNNFPQRDNAELFEELERRGG